MRRAPAPSVRRTVGRMVRGMTGVGIPATAAALRAERAARLRDFFELQLRFARHMAERTAQPLAESVLRFTNLHRRFGYGDPDRGVAPAWAAFVGPLRRMADLDAQTAWAVAHFRDAPEEQPPPDRHLFGSFGCEAPDARGVLRLHFVSTDSDGLGPLHRSKIARRQAELATMIAFVRRCYPQAAQVRGVSWLYHIDAYRRLFPPAYTATAVPASRVRLSGMSSWGQFIRHDGTIKPVLRDAFLRRLESIDPAAPWRSFPLPALTVAAPIETFAAFFACPPAPGGQGPP